MHVGECTVMDSLTKESKNDLSLIVPGFAREFPESVEICILHPDNKPGKLSAVEISKNLSDSMRTHHTTNDLMFGDLYEGTEQQRGNDAIALVRKIVSEKKYDILICVTDIDVITNTVPPIFSVCCPGGQIHRQQNLRLAPCQAIGIDLEKSSIWKYTHEVVFSA